MRNDDDPIIPNKDLERILEIAQVAPQKRKQAREELITLSIIVAGTTARPKRHNHSRAETVAYKVLARRCSELYEAINKLLDATKHEPMAHIRLFFDVLGDHDDDFDLYELQSRLTELADACEIILAKPSERKAPNRPRGSRQYPAVESLIERLVGILEGRGDGKLTLWREDLKWKGTLPEILSVLNGHLPALVTRNPPYATLQRCLSRIRCKAPREVT